MAILHLGALVALFNFAWKPFWMAVFLWWVSGSLGIGMGYHRLLTHRGYKCPRWIEYFLALCGTLALEGGPIFWVGVHRIHHQLTDRPGDPHSPRDGKWWSHMGWVLMGRSLHQDSKELLPYVPDLRKDRFYLLLSRWHWVPAAVVGVAVVCLRWLEVSAMGGLSAHRGRVALYLDGELRHSSLGLAAFRHRRRFA